MINMLPESIRIRNVIHSDLKLRKASDYLEYDMHTFVASLELYLKYCDPDDPAI